MEQIVGTAVSGAVAIKVLEAGEKIMKKGNKKAKIVKIKKVKKVKPFKQIKY